MRFWSLRCFCHFRNFRKLWGLCYFGHFYLQTSNHDRN